VDIYETAEKDVVIKAELPEMTRQDIKVTVENDVLTIEGERVFEKKADGATYHRVERGYGPFSRRFSLPPTVDAGKVVAGYRDGVLTVTLPQKAEARPKAITIEG
jgi:HSP20 family protein